MSREDFNALINVPAYTRTLKTLRKNYDFLPDGYSDIFIPCETLEELYADKIISFINTEKYVRHRDIWDLHWIKQQGTTLNTGFVKNKISDYNITDFNKKLDALLRKLHSIIYGDDFRTQMSRFTSLDVQERTLKNEKFYAYLTDELTNLLNDVKLSL